MMCHRSSASVRVLLVALRQGSSYSVKDGIAVPLMSVTAGPDVPLDRDGDSAQLQPGASLDIGWVNEFLREN